MPNTHIIDSLIFTGIYNFCVLYFDTKPIQLEGEGVMVKKTLMGYGYNCLNTKIEN